MSSAALEIVQIRAGRMDNFSYLIYSPESCVGIAVDPSLAPEALLAEIAARGVTLETLVNTHGHQDHVAGNKRVLFETGARLAAHSLDLPDADILLEEGAVLDVSGVEVKILHTPGHTPGSIVLNPPGALITGDTLFVTRCGRADFPGSDPEALYRSLMRLASYPPETLVYPGHDYGPEPSSTLEYELRNNPYLGCPDMESFLRLRMG